MDVITNGVSETRLCFFLKSTVFLSLPEKREIYLHNSEKSCNFAAQRLITSPLAPTALKSGDIKRRLLTLFATHQNLRKIL
jgi:hypothetical protein